jgi:hypothetical protein
MTSIRVGAALDAVPGPRYFEKHGLLELHPPLSFPRAATLQRWRASIPAHSEVALAVTRRAHGGKDGALRFDKPGARTWLDESIAALSPRFVVLATGPELSTGSRDRALLARFVEEVRAKGPLVVWQPRGLWEADEARRCAREIGCEIALDLLGAIAGPRAPGARELMGLEAEIPDTKGVAYGRIEALGTHARLGDGHLRRALEEGLATGAEELRLVVQSEDALRRTARLATLVEGLADDAAGFAMPKRRSAEGFDESEPDDEHLDDDDDDLDDDDLDDDDDDLDDDEE